MNPQLRAAHHLTLRVTRDLEPLLPQAAFTRVPETHLEVWLATLQGALTYLQSLAIPARPALTWIDGAKDRIHRARTSLRATPILSPPGYPQEEGWANLYRRPLEAILDHLHQALAFLSEALKAA